MISLVPGLEMGLATQTLAYASMTHLEFDAFQLPGYLSPRVKEGDGAGGQLADVVFGLAWGVHCAGTTK